MKKFHIAIVGGGVIGSAIAWELSHYKLDVAVFEKGSDVAVETSKANSGVVHSGINSPHDSFKARFCVEGNRMFDSLSDKLGFSLKWVGKYIIAKNENEITKLEKIMKNGIKNNVKGIKIIDETDVKKSEPNITCQKALYIPKAGIILPYEFTIALAENASKNNVKFYLETKVYEIQHRDDIFLIKTDKGVFESKIVINAAGLNCRDIISMIEQPNFNIYPCRGEYLVLDKKYNNLIKSMIYPVPPDSSGFLGVHITPTIEGNILLGPSAEFIDDSKDKGNTKEIMDLLLNKSREMIPSIPKSAVISAYSGIRCKLSKPETESGSDFRIEQSKYHSEFISLIGIESPGLTAAPAIAKEIVNMVSKLIEFKEKKEFYNYKIKTKRFSQFSLNEKSKMVMNDNRYGRIVCRCENITEAVVINALSNPLSAQTISSVKYRCRAGMGRCQGGFCLQHIVRIMENDFNIHVKEMKLKSPKSNLFSGKNRGGHNDKS